LRSEPEYRAGIERKRVAPGLIDEVLAADEARRGALGEVEELRARQNAASKEIGRAAPDERPAKIAAAASLKDELAQREPMLADAEARFNELVIRVPNPAHESVPDGGEDDYEVLRTVGDTPAAPAGGLDHAELGERLGFVDTERAARTSGSRFAYLMGEAVLLEMALVRWVMGRLVDEGFTPVVPPVLVRESMMEAAGFFPTDRSQVYEVDGGELFLVGTSEVPLAGIHLGETLAEAALPRRYAGFSSCFRREAGAAGRDTRGIFRVHQFDKVEMFSFVEPASSNDEHERILAIEEAILGELEIPYRVVDIPVGDLGPSAARKFDCEAWIPSQERYRELTSCSNTTDYQARRLGCRYRPADGESPQAAHTLNGTAVAVGRTMIALIENRQERDGGFTLPSILHSHGTPERIAASP
jgi:seryl-tRNA synthetase